jgi:hypothetical protein
MHNSEVAVHVDWRYKHIKSAKTGAGGVAQASRVFELKLQYRQKKIK